LSQFIQTTATEFLVFSHQTNQSDLSTWWFAFEMSNRSAETQEQTGNTGLNFSVLKDLQIYRRKSNISFQ